MRRWPALSLVTLFIVAIAIAASPEAEGITLTGFFTDDDGSTFEADIDAIAAVGITRGCNPPDNTLFCPDDEVDRGQMAAFLRRGRNLPSTNSDFFTDDDFSTFEEDIDAIAAAGITKGCNPPDNSLFCPSRSVTRGEMAAFLRRALDLPSVVQKIPIDGSSAMSCAKDGETCELTVDVVAGRPYQVQEGIFLVDPATSGEEAEFSSSNTTFTLIANGSELTLSELAPHTGGGVTARYWTRQVSFEPGTHALIGRWRWDGWVFKTNTITIRAAG